MLTEMKSLFLLFSSFFLLTGTVHAQHCPFDYAHILVVDVSAEGDSISIPNLHLTLLDSTGETVMTERWTGDRWEAQPIQLWQNPSSTTHSGLIDNNNPMNPWTIRFWFAEDNYVLVTGHTLKGAQLKIEDLDGKENQGAFSTTTIALSDTSLYSLCTGRSNWDRGEEWGPLKDFHPVQVKLTLD